MVYTGMLLLARWFGLVVGFDWVFGWVSFFVVCDLGLILLCGFGFLCLVIIGYLFGFSLLG